MERNEQKADAAEWLSDGTSGAPGPSADPIYPSLVEIVPEPMLYHDPSRRGFTAIFRYGKRSRQFPFPLSELPRVLQEQRFGDVDVYIAQNEFSRPNRKAENLRWLVGCYVDLDTYKQFTCAVAPEHQVERLLMFCDDNQIPRPSVVVYSGRGLQAKWIFERPVPSRVLPRWNALQRELGSRLLEMGADLRALDASRVLRLVGTINSRSGERVRVVHTQRTPACGGTIGPHRIVVYPFDTLFKEVMPIDRTEIENARKRRSGKRSTSREKARADDHRSTSQEATGRASTRRGLNQEQLAQDRLDDLRLLAKLRGFETGLPSGHRDSFVFLSACFLASMRVKGNLLENLHALAKEFAPTWSPAEFESCVTSVISRIEAARRGELVEYRGRSVDPRYRFRNSTLIDWLEISPEEQHRLKTIVSDDERRRRDRERKERSRRVHGKAPRADYLNEVRKKEALALRLRMSGKSYSEIATEIGISRSTARRYCRAANDAA